MVKEKDEKSKSEYNAKDITVLEGLEPVRKRPGMYLGTTGPDGLHHMITEIFDNSRDEAMGGFCDEIEVVFLPDSNIRVTDNGRGIPVDIHKNSNVSALETILTTLHAGGKFGDSGYKISGGLHGVGSSVVNALSVYMKAIIHRDGAVYKQEYSVGKKTTEVEKIGKSDKNGTIITFRPDESIFSTIKFDVDKVIDHMRQQAYLINKLKIRIIDARKYDEKISDDVFYFSELRKNLPSNTFFFEGGIKSLVGYYNVNNKVANQNIFSFTKVIGDVHVGVALQYVEEFNSTILAFANNIYNPNGGTHITGFKTALTRTINSYEKEKNITKEKEAFSGDDVIEGITAVITIAMPEVQFEGQTKAKLGSVEAKGIVEKAFAEAFSSFLEENPADAKSIINKVSLALKARKAAKNAKEGILRKGVLEGLTLPGKLTDCQSKDATVSELFIVEGDSAGGTARGGRARDTQAILPIRGKILNVWKSRDDKIFANEEVKAIAVALGSGIKDEINVEKLRYHKIIIATDADVDGAHITTLLLTLFFQFFRKLIEDGYIYIAQPPLYKIKFGKKIEYAYTDKQRDTILSKIGEDAKVDVQRYKGLGEMNKEELWETTMDPANRILKQITMDDAVKAKENFDILMGSDAFGRKKFIEENAEFAEIDI